MGVFISVNITQIMDTSFTIFFSFIFLSLSWILMVKYHCQSPSLLCLHSQFSFIARWYWKTFLLSSKIVQLDLLKYVVGYYKSHCVLPCTSPLSKVTAFCFKVPCNSRGTPSLLFTFWRESFPSHTSEDFPGFFLLLTCSLFLCSALIPLMTI